MDDGGALQPGQGADHHRGTTAKRPPLALSRFGRGHAAYSRLGLWGIAGVLGVGLLSIAVAYLRVRGYA